MLRYIITKTTRKRTGIATTNTRAQRTLMVNAITMEPRTIKRAAKQQPESHVQSVLHLIDIIGQSCDQGGGSKTVKLRIGKVPVHDQTQIDEALRQILYLLCCKKLAVILTVRPAPAIRIRIKKLRIMTPRLFSRNSHINHVSDHNRNHQVKYNFQKLEKGASMVSFCSFLNRQREIACSVSSVSIYRVSQGES